MADRLERQEREARSSETKHRCPGEVALRASIQENGQAELRWGKTTEPESESLAWRQGQIFLNPNEVANESD